ncbi:S8 family peptidase [[Actinomadura] parvosata]|uniref:S8 family peptidase n=1 Tax=[Actinomadura] parvosata TaxID=1955412 RepID=UPI00406C2C72
MPSLPSKSTAALSSLALVLAAVGVAPRPAHAALAPQAAAPVDTRPAPGPATLTLITGDIVDYAPGEDGGPPAIAVRPAPRPDGAAVTFATLPSKDGGYLVLPSDAAGMVAAGTLDEELFDVETLARDQRTGTIPLLVTYAGDPAPATLSRSANALPAGEDVRVLDSINGAAMSVDTGQAAAFWEGLRTDRPSAQRSASGPAKVWLDRKTHASLDQSVPLIGAPKAWELGYDGKGVKVAVLDSGIDMNHPDFAGRISATRNFSPTSGIADKVGHGTHVASTIAGAGETYRGVAPAATLLVGKVLDDNGDGMSSSTIAGMQWAAEQGAAVVNMSLGWCCGDGTDPLSQAVNALTKKHGTLFVAGAGNGYKALAVNSPAAADEALAVGGVDKVTGTELGDFSSRGPRLGDAAVKPNIVAPGVDIVAARAAGATIPGIPGNDRYLMASGTSMASPHVAGAAAILAQQHPEWRAAELRDALTSTAARSDGLNWFDQGSGRVDVARAVTQTVFATSAVDFRKLDGPATRQITYRNLGDEPVTLALSLLTRGWSGNPAPDGAVRLGADSVTVPANGAATVDLTAHLQAGARGVYGGWVTAQAGETRVVTPFSYYAEAVKHSVKVSLVNSYGTKEFYSRYAYQRPAVTVFPVKLPASPEDPFISYRFSSLSTDYAGDGELRLPAGEYELFGSLYERRLANRETLVIKTVDVDGDETVTLDARDTVRIRPDLPKPAHGAGIVRYQHNPDANDPDDHPTGFSMYWSVSGGYDLYVTPVAPPRTGTSRLAHQWAMEPPVLSKVEAGDLTLHPAYSPDSMRALTTNTTHPLVSVGRGRAEDFDGVDVTGKIVLAGVPAGDAARPYASAAEAMDAAGAEAARRGAVGILGYLDVDGGRARVPDGPSLRLGLSAAEGRAVRTALDRGPLSLRLEPYAGPDVVYNLRYDAPGQMPARPPKVKMKDLVRVDATYHADKANAQMRANILTATVEPFVLVSINNQPIRSQHRTEYYGPATGDVIWTREVTNESLTLKTDNLFTRREHRLTDRWFKAPLVPGAADVPSGHPVALPCGLCRDGDRFVPGEQWRDSDSRHYSDPNPVTSAPKLFVDDQGAATIQGYRPRYFTVPGRAGTYRLESTDTTGRILSRRVTTTTSFASTPPAGTPRGYTCSSGKECAFQPALQFAYDLPLDLLNRAASGKHFAFELRAGAHSTLRRAPEVKRVAVEYSVDDGATWRPAKRVTSRGDGRYRVEVTHPALADTSGYVSLRVTASDEAGGSATQTIERAYGLT